MIEILEIMEKAAIRFGTMGVENFRVVGKFV